MRRAPRLSINAKPCNEEREEAKEAEPACIELAPELDDAPAVPPCDSLHLTANTAAACASCSSSSNNNSSDASCSSAEGSSLSGSAEGSASTITDEHVSAAAATVPVASVIDAQPAPVNQEEPATDVPKATASAPAHADYPRHGGGPAGSDVAAAGIPSSASAPVAPTSNHTATSPAGGAVPASQGAHMSQQDIQAFVERSGLKCCRVVRDLGQGAFGYTQEVDIALPNGTTIKAARKTLLPQKNGHVVPALLQQEVAGLRAAAGCAFAVQLLGYSCPATEAEPVELLLTYVPGGTLAEYLEDLMRANQMRIFYGPPPTAKRTGQNKYKYERLPYTGATLMSEPELRALAIALLQVVKVMHARGYGHCDIKPANVLVDHAPDGSKVFRVCDMGIASKADKSGRLLQCPGGTPAFAAGEVLQKIQLGKSQYPVCLQSDMAAIGMVMAHAAAFRSLPGGLQQYARWERDLPHRTPPALKDFIEQLMSVDPAERLTPDQALAHPWLQ